jgi:hypothetical protein
MLLKIPGINSKNVHRVMSRVENLREMFQMTEEQLTEVLENSKAAKQVYEFVNYESQVSGGDDDLALFNTKRTAMPASNAGSSNGGRFLNTKSHSNVGGGGGGFKRTGSFSNSSAKTSRK